MGPFNTIYVGSYCNYKNEHSWTAKQINWSLKVCLRFEVPYKELCIYFHTRQTHFIFILVFHIICYSIKEKLSNMHSKYWSALPSTVKSAFRVNNIWEQTQQL